MMLMIFAFLMLFGLCLGSFVNALVWRVHEQEHESGKKKPRKDYLKELSIMQGRSMCPSCKHGLVAKDLVPVLSWLSVGGKCRYCRKPIAVQYPVVEIATAVAFVLSYMYWPVPLESAQIAIFVLWLLLVVGFMALSVYDLRWFLLPNRIVYPLGVLAGLLACVQVASAARPVEALTNTVLAVLLGGGIFFVIFQVSKGNWIGGGDVRLGWLLGLIVGTPAKSMLFIFLASILGTCISLPLLLSGKLKRNATIPFGPFLILGAAVVVLFGSSIIHWYRYSLLHY